MNDKELAEEIARGDLVIAAANPQHRYVPLEIKAQIIAALRRGPERPPSGEMVMVAREPTEAIAKAGESCYLSQQQDFSSRFWLRTLIEKLYRAMLSAAEAEGRKSCPLCGRTDPHSHTSGPLGMS